MEFQVSGFDSQGKKLKVPVAIDFVEKDVKGDSYSKLVRVLLNHLRQASSSTKTRGEIALSGKKPWKQKGTGRARVGSAKTPLWRKGGVIFGPKPGCTRLKVNRKERRTVLGHMVKERLSNGDFVGLVLPGVVKDKGLCAQTNSYMNGVGLGSEKLLFLLSSSDIESFRRLKNLKNVDLAFFDQLGALDLSRKGKVAFQVKDKEELQEAFGKWT